MSNVRRATTGGRRAAFVIVLHSMWRRAEGKFALIVLALWLLIAIVSLFWTPQSLWATDGYHVWAKPSAEHWLGTDGTGADVFSWLLAGSHTNLVIVLLTVVASMAWGLLLIAAMVARNAALASSSVVVVDALISVPTVLIALILAVPLGASIAVIVIACGFGYGLNLARVARPAALLASRSSYVESALANGASGWRVLISHVMPNILPVLAVQLSLSAGTAVLAESGLTYLGIGVPSAIQYAIFQVANLFIQFGVNSFDATMVAGNSAAANADGLVYDVMAAFYTACSSFIGQNYGAGNKERVRNSYFVSLAYSFGIGLVIGVTLEIFGTQFLSIFTTEQAVVDAGMKRLGIMGFSYCVSAFMDAAIAASRGLGKSVVPTIIVIMGSCVFRIIWVYTIFAYFKTIPSLYLLYVFSWSITAIVEMIYFKVIYHKQMTALRTA